MFPLFLFYVSRFSISKSVYKTLIFKLYLKKLCQYITFHFTYQKIHVLEAFIKIELGACYCFIKFIFKIIFVYRYYMNKENTIKFLEPAIILIKSFEGFRAFPYNDIANNATIGYGKLLHLGPVNEDDKHKYINGITETEASRFVENTCFRIAQKLTNFIKVFLNHNQFNALVSFIYNVGFDAFRLSTMANMINNKKFEEASKEFDKWVHANHQISKGLQNRRAKEKELFMMPSQPLVSL